MIRLVRRSLEGRIAYWKERVFQRSRDAVVLAAVTDLEMELTRRPAKLVDALMCVECESLWSSMARIQACPSCLCSKFLALGPILGTTVAERRRWDREREEHEDDCDQCFGQGEVRIVRSIIHQGESLPWGVICKCPACRGSGKQGGK